MVIKETSSYLTFVMFYFYILMWIYWETSVITPTSPSKISIFIKRRRWTTATLNLTTLSDIVKVQFLYKLTPQLIIKPWHLRKPIKIHIVNVLTFWRKVWWGCSSEVYLGCLKPYNKAVKASQSCPSESNGLLVWCSSWSAERRRYWGSVRPLIQSIRSGRTQP